MSAIRLRFCGATGTVTGSKYLLEYASRRLLIDCGLFQGYKQLRLRNWASPPFAAASLDAVALTHAHIDHSGYLPLLARQGFRGKVLCSSATRDLLGLMLPDAAHLQEEEANYANRKGYSKHHPAQPLYTMADAHQALSLLHGQAYDREIALPGGAQLRLVPNGHILGSSCAHLQVAGTSILFSGDLGRPNDPLMLAPRPPRRADYLVIESTYGNRRHAQADPAQALAEVINRTAARGGVLVVPAFAVGRSQSLLLHIHRLKAARRIADIPVYLNSPMAGAATNLYLRHLNELRIDQMEAAALFAGVRFIESPEESRRLNARNGPMIIISASGMATGGRVLHHLARFAPDPRNTVLFAGYQAGGTRGASLVAGEKTVKIHGEQIPVNAEVCQLDSLSSHADGDEIIAWLRGFEKPPRHTFIVHGEPASADALRRKIQDELAWPCSVPEYLESATLD